MGRFADALSASDVTTAPPAADTGAQPGAAAAMPADSGAGAYKPFDWLPKDTTAPAGHGATMPAAEPPARPSEGIVAGGVKRAFHEGNVSLAAIGAMGGEALSKVAPETGAKLRDWSIGAMESQRAEAEKHPAQMGALKDIKSVGDIGRYALERSAEFLPMVAETLAGAAIGGAVGAAAGSEVPGAGNVAGGVGGVVAGAFGRGAIKHMAEKLAARYGEEQAKRIATKAFLTNAGRTAGAFAATAPQTIGAEYDPNDPHIASALGYGTAKALLMTGFGARAVVRKLGGPAAEATYNAYLKQGKLPTAMRFLHHMTANAGEQAGTMAGVEALSIAKQFTDGKLKDVRDIDFKQAAENVVAGVAGGLLLSGVHGVKATAGDRAYSESHREQGRAMGPGGAENVAQNKQFDEAARSAGPGREEFLGQQYRDSAQRMWDQYQAEQYDKLTGAPKTQPPPVTVPPPGALPENPSEVARKQRLDLALQHDAHAEIAEAKTAKDVIAAHKQALSTRVWSKDERLALDAVAAVRVAELDREAQAKAAEPGVRSWVDAHFDIPYTEHGTTVPERNDMSAREGQAAKDLIAKSAAQRAADESAARTAGPGREEAKGQRQRDVAMTMLGEHTASELAKARSDMPPDTAPPASLPTPTRAPEPAVPPAVASASESLPSPTESAPTETPAESAPPVSFTVPSIAEFRAQRAAERAARKASAPASESASGKATATAMGDAATEQHFTNWLDANVTPDDRQAVEGGMRAYVDQHPETISEMGWGWSTVRDVALREGFIKDPSFNDKSSRQVAPEPVSAERATESQVAPAEDATDAPVAWLGDPVTDMESANKAIESYKRMHPYQQRQLSADQAINLGMAISRLAEHGKWVALPGTKGGMRILGMQGGPPISPYIDRRKFPLKPLKRVSPEEAVASHATKDDTRYVLKGVLHDADAKVVVATDGRRLLMVPSKVGGTTKIVGPDGKSIDGTFPNYRAVIPVMGERGWTPENTKTIALDIDGARQVGGMLAQVQRSLGVTAPERAPNAPHAVIEGVSVNPAYLRDMVEGMVKSGAKSISVTMRMDKPTAMLFKADNGAVGVLMPMRTESAKTRPSGSLDVPTMPANTAKHMAAPMEGAPARDTDAVGKHGDGSAAIRDPAARAELTKRLYDIVRKYGGEAAARDMGFADKIVMAKDRLALGQYLRGKIDIALGTGDEAIAAVHEVGHLIEDLMLGDKELAEFRAAFPNEEARMNALALYIHGGDWRSVLRGTKEWYQAKSGAEKQTMMRRVADYLKLLTVRAKALFGANRGMDRMHQFFDEVQRGKYAGDWRADYRSLPATVRRVFRVADRDGLRYKMQYNGATYNVDRSHDVPLGGGVSRDGKTVYVDKRVPVQYVPQIAVHEVAEARHGLDSGQEYPDAHNELAVPAERAWLQSHGLDYDATNKELAPYLRLARDNKQPVLPADMLAKPMGEEGHDPESPHVDVPNGTPKDAVASEVPGIATAPVEGAGSDESRHMAGYDWKAKKSNNAVAAEEEGRTQWFRAAKEYAKRVPGATFADVHHLFGNEYHHVGKAFRKANYVPEPANVTRVGWLYIKHAVEARKLREKHFGERGYAMTQEQATAFDAERKPMESRHVQEVKDIGYRSGYADETERWTPPGEEPLVMRHNRPEGATPSEMPPAATDAAGGTRAPAGEGAEAAKHMAGAAPTNEVSEAKPSEFTYRDKDDDFYYHVTTDENADKIMWQDNAIHPSGDGGTFTGRAARLNSGGKVFLTERSGVKTWMAKVQQQLEHSRDFEENEDAADFVRVLRIPKGMVADAKPDPMGEVKGDVYVERSIPTSASDTTGADDPRYMAAPDPNAPAADSATADREMRELAYRSLSTRVKARAKLIGNSIVAEARRMANKGTLSQLIDGVQHSGDYRAQQGTAPARMHVEGDTNRAAMNFVVQAGEREPQVVAALNALRAKAVAAGDAAETARIDAELAAPTGKAHIESEIAKLQAAIANPPKDAAPIWLSRANQALYAAQYALKNYDRLAQHVKDYREPLNTLNAIEHQWGVGADHIENYMPRAGGVDTGAWIGGSRPYVVFSNKGTGASTGHQKARVYGTLGDLYAGGDSMRTLDSTELLQHRLAAGYKAALTREVATNQFAHMTDPSTGKPVVQLQDADKKIPKGYAPVELAPGFTVNVQEGYNGLLKALVAPSALQGQKWAVAKAAVAGIKHGTLLLDSYHLSRMAFRYAAVNKFGAAGTGGWIFKEAKRAQALMDFTDAANQERVAKGELTPEEAQWASDHRAMFERGLKHGLNSMRIDTQLGTAILKETRTNWEKSSNPLLRAGAKVLAFNPYVFQKITRSAMALTYVTEVKRAMEATGKSEAEVAPAIAHKVNAMFGNLGKQGFVKSRTVQELLPFAFLAPQWVESLGRFEAGAVADVARAGVAVAKGQKAHVGTHAMTIGMGLMGMVLANQFINMATTGHGTWDNDDEHKWDAEIPGTGGQKYYLDPALNIAEISARVLGGKGTVVENAAQEFQNKLSPVAHAEETLRTGKNWRGERIPGDARRVGEAVNQMVPIPLGAAGLVSNTPGAMGRQALASLGAKVELAPSAEQALSQHARKWLADHGHAPTVSHVPDEGAGYAGMNRALASGNKAAIVQAALDLHANAPDVDAATIAKHYASLKKRPLTGKVEYEREWLRGLTPEERKAYAALRVSRVKQAALAASLRGEIDRALKNAAAS